MQHRIKKPKTKLISKFRSILKDQCLYYSVACVTKHLTQRSNTLYAPGASRCAVVTFDGQLQ